jgi:ABC-type bacteriocin/lantibiotic exporter with double-glycine peptidase domain
VTANYSTVSDFIGLMGQARCCSSAGPWCCTPGTTAGGGLAPNAHPELTIGELTAFILYLGSFFQPIQQLVQLYNTYQQGQAAVSKLRTLLATEPSVRKGRRLRAPSDRGRDRLRDVEFGYDPADPVLRDVNIAIRAGESVAFVGPRPERANRRSPSS